MRKALNKPEMIRVQGSRTLPAATDPAPLTSLRQLRRFERTRPNYGRTSFFIFSVTFDSGEGRAKITARYDNGSWPSKAPTYPIRFYCLIFLIRENLNSIFPFLDGDNEKNIEQPWCRHQHRKVRRTEQQSVRFQMPVLGWCVEGKVTSGSPGLFHTRLTTFALCWAPQAQPLGIHSSAVLT